MKRITVAFLFPALILLAAVLVISGISNERHARAESDTVTANSSREEAMEMANKVIKTDEEWKKILTPEQYRIMRKQGTEPRGSGKYYHFTENGTFLCGACGSPLFHSEHKYDSGSGWPSFWLPLEEENITTAEDKSLFMTRTEVLCSSCDAHLGHLFEDGPPPTGMRYCINSASLDFLPESKTDETE